MSRFQEQLRTIPPGTLGAIGLCTSLYLFQIVTDLPSLQTVTLCPRLVLYNHEVYRIITSALFHASLLHIGMNMMSTTAVGSMLERRLGSLKMILTMLWSILLTSILHIASAWLLFAIFGMKSLFYEHSVGFSGVIFHLSVLECSLGTHQSRSVFGFFEVPSYLYPWVLLVVLQLVMPNLSFAGHLSGIVAGTLQLQGMLDWLFPKDNLLKELEGRSGLRWLSSWPSFVPTTDVAVVTGRGQTLRQFVSRGFSSIATFVMNIAETVKVAIFGRGRMANQNIHLGLLDEDDVDDDSWNGLPPASRDTTSQIV